MKQLKIAVACGGTSGHINPALAIANEIRIRRPDTEFLFIGTENKLEATLVPRAGYPIRFIDISGINRAKSLRAFDHNVKTAYKFVHSVRDVKKILKEFGPDLVIGTGGYVSAPVLQAACSLHIKTLIHEQNAFAGMTTKLFSSRVDRIMLSFPLAKPLDADPSRIVLSGNPVDRAFGSVTREEARAQLGIPVSKTVVLSFGGSLGAKRLNEAVAQMLSLSCKDGLIEHYHGCGAGGSEKLAAMLGDDARDPHIHLCDYIYNMPLMMAAADLVVARSGAGTVTELQASGRASILVPSPNVTENHQFFNAKTLSDINASVLLEEKDLNGDVLYEAIKEIVFDSERRFAMERAALSSFNRETLSVILREVEALTE